MRYCWSCQDAAGNILVPGVVMFGVVGIAEIISFSAASNNPTAAFIHFMILFIVLYSVPALCAAVSSRKYQLCDSGITLRYWGGIYKTYSWHDFSEIALCKVHYASGSMQHIVAIRCSLGETADIPKDTTSTRIWCTTMLYECFHFNKVVSIYYTEDRYNEFMRFCKNQIKDYRGMVDRI